MKFGVCLPNYGETGSEEALRTVAIKSEELGYDSVWTTDHVLMPTKSETPYESILESLASLAYLAGITGKVKLGVSSLILAMRNPIVAVKQLATVDILSGGRLMLATSAGWNEKEFEYLGSNFHDRGVRLDEYLQLLRALWISGLVRFDGKRSRITCDQAVFEPQPVQRKLTVWIAGNSKAAMRRAIKYGDAWHPNVPPLDAFKNLVAEFRKLPGAERKPICVRIGMQIKSKNRDYVSPRGDKRLILSSDMGENRNTISALAEIGVEYAVVAPSFDGKVSVDEQLDGITRLRDEVIHSV